MMQTFFRDNEDITIKILLYLDTINDIINLITTSKYTLKYLDYSTLWKYIYQKVYDNKYYQHINNYEDFRLSHRVYTNFHKNIVYSNNRKICKFEYIDKIRARKCLYNDNNITFLNANNKWKTISMIRSNIIKRKLFDNIDFSNIAKISASRNHAILLDKDNYLYVTGNNVYNQIGLNLTRYSSKLEKLIINKEHIQAKYIKVGYGVSSYIDYDNKLYIIGTCIYNRFGLDIDKLDKFTHIKLDFIPKKVDYGDYYTLYQDINNKIYISGKMYSDYKIRQLKYEDKAIIIKKFSAGKYFCSMINKDNNLFVMGRFNKDTLYDQITKIEIHNIIPLKVISMDYGLYLIDTEYKVWILGGDFTHNKFYYNIRIYNSLALQPILNANKEQLKAIKITFINDKTIFISP